MSDLDDARTEARKHEKATGHKVEESQVDDYTGPAVLLQCRCGEWSKLVQ